MREVGNVRADIAYNRALYAPEDALLRRIREHLQTTGFAWQIGAEEGRLLQLLIRLYQVKTIVEIGTLAAYSTIWMARALPEGGHIHTIDRHPDHARDARAFIAESEVANRITLHESDAHDLLPTLALTVPLDMVLIDADKPGYNAYLDWAEQHLRPGGLVVADNTLLFGSVVLDAPPAGVAPSTWASMRRFNERLADTHKFFTCMIPTEEGLTVAVKL